jgi:hypothetical protein
MNTLWLLCRRSGVVVSASRPTRPPSALADMARHTVAGGHVQLAPVGELMEVAFYVSAPGGGDTAEQRRPAGWCFA